MCPLSREESLLALKARPALPVVGGTEAVVFAESAAKGVEVGETGLVGDALDCGVFPQQPVGGRLDLVSSQKLEWGESAAYLEITAKRGLAHSECSRGGWEVDML